jgi:dipeptidyl aminopeptidase/acylaminoacyl peptidase
MSLRYLLVCCALMVSIASHARPMTSADLVTLRRIGAVTVSPDERRVVWHQSEASLVADEMVHSLWQLDLRRAGAHPEKVSETLATQSVTNPRAPQFTPDGRWIYFIGDEAKGAELWRVAATGGTVERMTDYDVEVSGFAISPTGERIAVWSETSMSCEELPCRVPRAADVCCGMARTFDHLAVRRNDEWITTQSRSHIYLPRWQAWMTPEIRSRIYVLSSNGGKASAIQGRLTGELYSSPVWDPRGETLFFSLRSTDLATHPRQPNAIAVGIFAARADGAGEPVTVIPAKDTLALLPTISPNGEWLAYTSSPTPTAELCSSEVSLRHLSTGQTKTLQRAWTGCVDSLAWTHDGRDLLVTARNGFNAPLFRASVKDGSVTALTDEGHVSFVAPMKDGGAVIGFDSMLQPADLHRLAKRARRARMTNINADRLADIDMPDLEHFRFVDDQGAATSGWMVAPRVGEKLPVVILSSPASGDAVNAWSYAWNPLLLAAPGYAVIGVESPASVEDLRRTLAAAAEQSSIDVSNACFVGQGAEPLHVAGDPSRELKCFVAHAAIFDARAVAYETDEPALFEARNGLRLEQLVQLEQVNPVNRVAAWTQPLLLLHGELDSRVPYTQSIAAFTAAQRHAVPSRLVVFPNEGRWVARPKNTIQWYGEVFNWLHRWLSAEQAHSSTGP